MYDKIHKKKKNGFLKAVEPLNRYLMKVHHAEPGMDNNTAASIPDCVVYRFSHLEGLTFSAWFQIPGQKISIRPTW